jgi:hypothetical protein
MKAIFLLLMVAVTMNALTQNKRFIETYKRESGLFKTLTVPMSYDSDSIARAKSGAHIGQVYRIDYVASSYYKGVSDYQKNLDARRWEQLYSYAKINKADEFETNIYYQTSAQTEEEASKLFHGFVVYYGEPATEVHSSALSSLPTLMNTIAEKEITKETKSITLTKPKSLDTVFVGDITATRMKELTAKNTKENVIVEWQYDSIGRNKLYYNTRFYLTKVSAGIFIAYNALKDKSLLQMFRRFDTDKNTLIVTDMTGSMSPYYSQLMIWHALRTESKRKENYVFFNDGDTKNDAEKIMGSTGGLYSVKTDQLFEVYNTMSACMKKGSGGDCPENNFEAVLHGLEKYDSIQKIILICDNWAVPRDRALLKNITIPIDFVMCGTSLGINPAYLNMAHQNKGKIHTIEKSITNLDKLEDGEKFSIGTRAYVLRKGGIVEMK